MSFWKKRDVEPEGLPVVEESAEVGSAADVDAVMKKYDRESNVRVWEGVPKRMVQAIMALFSIFCIYLTLFDRSQAEFRYTMFLGLIIIIGYLNFPARKGHVKVNSLPWYDILLMVAGAGVFFYFATHLNFFVGSQADTRFLTREPWVLAMAVVGIVVIIELCRRSVGLPILCVMSVLLIYALVVKRPGEVIYKLFYLTSGIMGAPIQVCQKYIVVFIIFGAFLERTGISKFFINLANCIAGASSGGPAKVAVISSALCGMVSGSSVGNTVTTGSVTIPMMKKTGYKPEFAGAVEAAASTGGQIMPPIMGAAAFLMAETTGILYGRIALVAILPAVIYFMGIYISVHLEAKRLGLRGISRERLPKFKDLSPRIYLLLPLVVLVVMVSTGTRSMQFSAAVAILVAIAVGLINNLVNSITHNADRSDNISLSKVWEALEAGGRGTITVAVACAVAGIVAGCITATGLASELVTMVINITSLIPWHALAMLVALLLTMLCCIVLGMGVPTTATYCIMAATCAPILVAPQIGVEMIAAHFFVFYFGIVADITPPVALAAYAGSAIAKSDPMKTGVNATRLAIGAFIVPYIFCLSPQMLLVDAMWYDVVLITLTALLGIFGVAAGLGGYIFRPMRWWERALTIAGGLTLMIPGIATDIIGVVLVGGVCVLQYLGVKASKAA